MPHRKSPEPPPEVPVDVPLADLLASLPAPLRDAIVAKGYTALTPVQNAVLDPALAGRDLRISSQTGSGKTLALGFVLAPQLEGGAKAPHNKCVPLAIVVTPTRELAQQVRSELGWLFEGLKLKVTAVTGGTSVPLEIRELQRGTDIVVGTPGRLCDHLDRKIIDASKVKAVVLDEADEMLDLGFRDELEKILGKLPEGRRTHLVSATFSRDVLALASKYQQDAVGVEGTRLGAANIDISHVVHQVSPGHRVDALVNLLLRNPDDQTLVFVKTRAETASLTRELSAAGFLAASLSGEMEQRDRTRTLASFKKGTVRVLVATDVAARGIDVADIGQVIHADPPGDADIYTHRSGRTGRAGKKGASIVLCPPSFRDRVGTILRRARVTAEWKPLPSATEILALQDEKMIEELNKPAEELTAGRTERLQGLASKLLASGDAEAVVMRLLQRVEKAGRTLPRDIPEAPTRSHGGSSSHGTASSPRAHSGHPAHGRSHASSSPSSSSRFGGAPSSGPGAPDDKGFVPFRIGWGKVHGADPRPLLAVICRRGDIRGSSVGSIKIGQYETVFGIAESVAGDFTAALKKSETGDPRMKIEPVGAKPIAVHHKAKQQGSSTSSPSAHRKPYRPK